MSQWGSHQYEGTSQLQLAEPGSEHDHKAGDVGANGHKSHPIFDTIKSGMLVPVQTVVEQIGPEVLTMRDDKGHTPAHWACLGGHTTILRYLLENKAPVDEPSNNDLGARPIHWACVNGHIAIVDILVQAGVGLDVMDNKGCTPLIVAAQYGQTMLAGYLMGKGARLQMVDKDGDNALHWAAFKGKSELMRLLIYSGFNAKQKDNFGQTPLHLACINGDLVSVRELCEQEGLDLAAPDKNGKTPLMLATGRKHLQVVDYIKSELKHRNSLLPNIDFWSIVFGPPGNSKGPLLFFFVNLLCWGYPMYVFKCLPYTWYDLQMLHILFFVMNVFMWFCLFHASTIDPGYLPRNIPEYDMAIKQVAHFDEWKQGDNPLSRLCHTCRTVKPIRSKHCKVCNRCVKVFDHHCPYIYNCVGVNNRHWFLLFVLSVLVNVYITDFFCYYITNEFGWDWVVTIGMVEAGILTIAVTGLSCMMVCFRVSFSAFCNSVMINGAISIYLSFYTLRVTEESWNVVYVIYMFIMFFFEGVAIYLSVSMLTLALSNMTTNESINHKRYKHWQDKDGKFHNPFDRGLRINVLEFLLIIPTPQEYLETDDIFHASFNLTVNERVNHKRYGYLKDGKGDYYNPFNRGVIENLKEFFRIKKPLEEKDVELLNIKTV